MHDSIRRLRHSGQPVPLLDLERENQPIREQVLQRIAAVYDSGRFLHGPDVQELEAQLAKVSGVPFGVGCASGSDALLLSLMAAGVGPRDEVLLPSFTFFATASAVSRLGARPIFIDIDPTTFNINPDLLEPAITTRTKAIIPVHLFGQCAAMDRICEIAAAHSLLVVEDAAQAIGATHLGQPAGSWGDVGCISFYPTKNLGGLGDGGMLVTRDEDLADRLRLYAAHGMRPRYYHEVVGINSRLDTIQAAALAIKLQDLDQRTQQRRENAAHYRELFAEAGLDRVLGLPADAANGGHVWNQFTIRVPDGQRDNVRAALAAHGVGTEIYYPHPLHLQTCFADVGFASGSLHETERAAAEVLSLPIFPGLTLEEQRVVVGRIAEHFTARQASAA